MTKTVLTEKLNKAVIIIVTAILSFVILGCFSSQKAMAKTYLTNEEFINTVGAFASDDMKQTGILASLTVAQAILESGWGKSTLADEANNLFGIKGNYQGSSFTINALEYDKNNNPYIERSAFKKYPSWAESIADHSALFLNYSRYKKLIGCTDYKLACKYVYEAGYATDTSYTSKLISLIESYGLDRFDNQKAKYSYTPCYKSAEVTATEITLHSDPATKIGTTDTKVGTAKKGKALTVMGIYSDKSGNKWYCLNNGQYVSSTGVALGDNKPSISVGGMSVPTYIITGYDFDIAGNVASAVTNINKIEIILYDQNKKAIAKKSVAPNKMSYDLAELNSSFRFSALGYGKYYYGVYVTNGIETSRVAYYRFEVIKKGDIGIFYSANGGSGAPTGYKVNKGERISVSPTIPKRANYEFAGWSTSNTATEGEYFAGDYITLNTSCSLYAVWKPASLMLSTSSLSVDMSGKKTDTITLHLSGKFATGTKLYIGDADTTIAAYKWVNRVDGENGSTIDLTITGKKKGNDTIYITVHKSSTDTTEICNRVKLSLSVSDKTTFTVNYSANGGSDAPTFQTKKSGETIVLTDKKPTRSGYYFAGWSYSKANETINYKAKSKFNENRDVMLYAVWKPIVIKASSNYVKIEKDGTATLNLTVSGGDSSTIEGFKTNHTNGIQVDIVKEYEATDGYHYIIKLTGTETVLDGVLKIYLTPTSLFSGVEIKINYSVYDSKNTGILKIGTGKYVYYYKGFLHRGWATINGKNYFARKDNLLVNGAIKVNGNTYLLVNYTKQGEGFAVYANNNYYLDSNGIIQTGWLEVDGQRYYALSSGIIQTGIVEIDQIKYLTNSQGAFVKDGIWTADGLCYVADSEGVVSQGEITKEDGTIQTVTSEGLGETTGFVIYNNNKYYILPETMSMATGFTKIEDKTYYFDQTTGKMITGFVKIGDYKYLFSSKGVMQTGFYTNKGGTTHYFTATGKMVTGFVTINKNKYLFLPNGVMYTGFYTNKSGTSHYFYSDGKMATGFITIDGYKYLFKDNGVMYTGFYTNKSGTSHYFYSDGKMATGFVKIEDNKYLFKSNGVMIKGVYTNSKGQKLYFDETDGKLVTDKEITIDGITYICDSIGVMTQKG